MKIKLVYIFLKIGLFTFGGGYAMIALLEAEFVQKRKWIDKEEFLDMVAVAESTPGPVAVNSATYIGYKLAGFWGALAATIAVCIPSLIIIYAISLFFDRFLELTYVAKAFKGIQVCVIYLIASAGIRLFKGIKKNAFSISIFAIVLLLFVGFSFFAIKFSSIYFILASGIIGVCFYTVNRLGRAKK